MNIDRAALFQLLPSLYRLRDADNGGVLGALLDVFAEQVQVLQEDLAQLYDDQFIETCADWVVPYIGDLIGYRQLNGVAPSIASPRAEVANTIHLRRGKGTVAVLEGLARDVTGWEAHIVEYFLHLAVTQSTKHVRPGLGGTVNLRLQPVLDRIGSPFDSAAHMADFRGLGGNGGRYNLPSVGIHLWRLGSAGLSQATAFGLDGTRFFFNPLGADMPLFSRPVQMSSDTAMADEANLPLPISRRGMAANPDLFGINASVFVEGLPEGTTVLAADLSDLDAAGTQWAHTAAAGTLLLDPQRGRIVFAEAQATAPRVSFRHASQANLGGGEYERLATLDLALLPICVVQPGADGVQAALSAVSAGGAAELPNSGTYAETPTIILAANALVELRAADQTRPVLQLGGELKISGGAGAELTINGLVISGGALRISTDASGMSMRKLRLVHCTLVPGLTLQPDGSASLPGAPSLIVEAEGVQVELDHCIVGAMRIAADCALSLTACIVDAGDPANVALAGIDGAEPGAQLQAIGSTLIGRIHTAALPLASECILYARGAVVAEAPPWPAPVWSERRQDGCVRFCYLPLDSLVPRRYRCQPAADAAASNVMPMFASLRYGDAAYARLARRTAPQILGGAEDGGEMGIHHEQGSQQRERNLRLRLAEYMRVGLDCGLLFAD